MKTVIIILGAARSGSTLLAKAIGGHSMGFTLGEINRFNNEINNEETHCGCAEKLSHCDFWNDVIKKLKEKTGFKVKENDTNFKVGIFNQLTKSKKFKLILTILFKKAYRNHIVDKQIDNTLNLYETLFEKTNSKILIDSSKGLFRALVLASRSNEYTNFKFVQLTRDGRGVLNSSLKSSYSVLHKDGVLRKYQGEKGKKPSTVINSWLYINLRNFVILKLFYRYKTSFVRYEDFTSDPAKTLKKIYTSVQLNFEIEALNLGEKENHIMGGNASRINAKSIKKQDDAWRKNLDINLIKEFNSRAGWFNKLMGYND